MVIDISGRIDGRHRTPPDTSAIGAWLDAAGLDRVLVANWAAASAAAGGADAEEVEANLACREFCRASSRLLAAYWVRAGRFDSHPHVLAGALAEEPFAAAVFAPLLNGFSLEDHQLLAPYLSILPHVRRPAVIHLGPDEQASVAAALAMVRRHPAGVFILASLGQLSDPTAGLVEIARALQRDCPAVYVDTAGLRPQQIAYAAEVLGASRLLFGSGATLLQEQDAARCRQMLADLQQVLCAEDVALVTARNAAELFGLKVS